jgi:hypothetical protein
MVNRQRHLKEGEGEQVRGVLPTEHMRAHSHTRTYLWPNAELENLRKIYVCYVPIEHGFTAGNENTALLSVVIVCLLEGLDHAGL